MGVRIFLGWSALSLTFAVPAFAETEPPAIWYRASEACPGGAQFLDKLAENSRQARLAQAGDHIDFVVTLIATGQETVGRLERQTDSGSVAIRELRDATCERVADALALSLGLALAPGSSAAPPVIETSAPTSVVLADVAPSAKPEASPTSSPSTPRPESRTTARAPDPAVPGPDVPSSRPRWSMGLGFGAMIGISTHPLPRAEIFADVGSIRTRALPNLSLRAGVVGAWGSSETAVGPVQRWIVAGRAEACPVAWDGGRVELRPCIGFELGTTGVSIEGEAGDDRSLWAAPGGQLRLALALQPKWLWLEANGGALVPLTRNEIFSGSQSLYRDAPAVFHLNLAISLRLP